jgi:hypothetical protein
VVEMLAAVNEFGPMRAVDAMLSTFTHEET